MLHDSRYGHYAAGEIRAAIAADPDVSHRLSMWARRLVGEALRQAQRVAADRAALADLLAGTEEAPISGMFTRLTEAHTERMAAVGLHN